MLGIRVLQHNEVPFEPLLERRKVLHTESSTIPLTQNPDSLKIKSMFSAFKAFVFGV
jgi:hypothetical protein